VRRFYDANESSFNARRIAQEAFVAGNDVLVLGNFGLGATWEEQLTTIKSTVVFFQNKYVDDPAFAARVDSAVRRIVALKLGLYGGKFDLLRTLVNPPPAGLTGQLEAQQTAATLAKESITLLSPSPRDLRHIGRPGRPHPPNQPCPFSPPCSISTARSSIAPPI